MYRLVRLTASTPFRLSSTNASTFQGVKSLVSLQVVLATNNASWVQQLGYAFATCGQMCLPGFSVYQVNRDVAASIGWYFSV